MIIIKQLAIVILILASLPLAIRIAWKLRLFPLALYLVATKLFFPNWASQHTTLCLCLLAGSILYFFLWWGIRLYREWEERKYDEFCLLATSTPLYPIDTTK